MKQDFAQLYLEHQLCFPLYAASRLTTKLYTPYLNELGVTYPQYLVLLVLWEHGEQRVREIGKKLLLETNTLTPLLKRLEQMGLVVRERSVTDERSVVVRLTKQGKQLQKTAATIPQKMMEELADGAMGAEEISTFKHMLQQLVQVLEKKVDRE